MQLPLDRDPFFQKISSQSTQAITEVARLTEENENLRRELSNLRKDFDEQTENIAKQLAQLENTINAQFLNLATTLSLTLGNVSNATTVLTCDVQRILDQEDALKDKTVENAKRLETVAQLIVQGALLNMKKTPEK